MIGSKLSSSFLRADAKRYVFEKLLPLLTNAQLKTIKEKLALELDEIVDTLKSLDFVRDNHDALKSFESFSDALVKELQPILDTDQRGFLYDLQFEIEECLNDPEADEEPQLTEHMHAVDDALNKLLVSDEQIQRLKDMLRK